MLEYSFYMQSNWGARVETPAALAKSFLETIDAISSLHPFLCTWEWGDQQEVMETEGEGGAYPFAKIRKHLIPAIERNMGTEGNGTPNPFYGYLMTVAAEVAPFGSVVSLSMSASHGVNGGSQATAFVNYADFRLGTKPVPPLVSSSFVARSS